MTKRNRSGARKWRTIPLALLLCAGLILFALSARIRPVPALLAVPEADSQPRNSYELELEYEPRTQKLTGRVSIHIINTAEQPWDRLCFADWASADVFSQAPFGGRTVLANAVMTRHAQTSVVTLLRDSANPCKWELPLETVLLPGEEVRLSFDLTISVPENRSAFGCSNGVCRLGNAIPQLAYWNGTEWVVHPHSDFSENAVSDCADYRMTLRAPKDVTVICTGESDTREGITQAHAENVRDFAVVIGKGWHSIEKQYGNTRVRCSYKGSPLMGRKALAAACDALGAFGSTLGAYPYSTLDIVSVDLEVAGMEYPQLVMINEDDFAWSIKLFQGYEQDLFRKLIAHEVAHQWFYGVIGNDQYLEPWLDEAFSQYLEGVYAAYAGVNHAAMNVDSEYPLNSSLEVLNSSYLLQSKVYWGGASFLNEMQETLGEDAFFAALQRMYQQYGYRVLDTQSALNVFRNAANGEYTEAVEALIEKYF